MKKLYVALVMLLIISSASFSENAIVYAKKFFATSEINSKITRYWISHTFGFRTEMYAIYDLENSSNITLTIKYPINGTRQYTLSIGGKTFTEKDDYDNPESTTHAVAVYWSDEGIEIGTAQGATYYLIIQ